MQFVSNYVLKAQSYFFKSPFAPETRLQTSAGTGQGLQSLKTLLTQLVH